jgi:sporulation protein YlmC with PRC-barrel domain
MKPDGPIQLVAQLRDIQIVDCEGTNCGVVDDIEFEGKPGATLRIKALLVGPGAYTGRLPRWTLALVRLVAGSGCVHVPWRQVESITSVVRLRCAAADAGLARGEGRAKRLLPKIGALK